MAIEEADDICEVGDADCAVSLRQLRAEATLSTEGGANREATAEADAEMAKDLHFAEALQRRSRGGANTSTTFTSLLETFTGKGGVPLYHQTSPEIAAMIMRTGFKPGSAGWCGGAIYFAQNPKATFTKAIGTQSHTGVILQANVNLGRVCKMAKHCDMSMTPQKANAMGCDTIEFNPGDGNEFVIYDSRRVKAIKPIWSADRATAMTLSSELSKGTDGKESTNTALSKEIESTVGAAIH